MLLHQVKVSTEGVNSLAILFYSRTSCFRFKILSKPNTCSLVDAFMCKNGGIGRFTLYIFTGNTVKGKGMGGGGALSKRITKIILW